MSVKLSATHVLKNNKIISKDTFIKTYAQLFNLDINEVEKDILALKKKFKVKFTTNGPVIFTQLFNNEPKFCWGDYAILLNIYDLNKSYGVGGTDSKGGPYSYSNEEYAIHPNIHVDFNRLYFTGYKICIGNKNIPLINRLIKSGNIELACSTLIDILNNTDSDDDLFEDFEKIHFLCCKSCGDYINVGENQCDICSEK